MAFVNRKRAVLTVLVPITFTYFFVGLTDHGFAFHGALKILLVIDECILKLQYLEKARSVP